MTAKLTPKQQETYDLLAKYKDGYLRPHRTMSDTFCFRLLDADRSPISNIQERWIKELKELKLLFMLSDNTFEIANVVVEKKSDSYDMGNIGLNSNSFSKAS